MQDYQIRAARPGEGARLHRIEIVAGDLFREIGMDDIADAPGTPAARYEHFIEAGQVIVAERMSQLAGFLSWEPRDDRSFIYEVSVHPDHQGRAIGARLIDEVVQPSLSCFTDVPWNKPYYERLGFIAVGADVLGPDHVDVAKDEAKRFAPWPRCIMAR